MIFKFNGGLGAILCENCGVIIFSGDETKKYVKCELTGDEFRDMRNSIEFFCCEDCCNKYYEKRKKRAVISPYKHIYLSNDEFDYGHNVEYTEK